MNNLKIPGRWPAEKSWAWYEVQPWIVGCNFLPSSAINQLEMWQAETYDPETIDRELGWARGLGFNVVRVYLHDLLWLQDAEGFWGRMEDFLEICTKHGLRVLFVFFDDCHRPDPVVGVQPLPVRGFHNSGWVVSPSKDVRVRYGNGQATPMEQESLRNYLQSTLERFGNDPRVIAWELYNEPGQDGAGESSVALLLDAWRWAREVNPSQPLCSTADGCVGEVYIDIALANSDVISFHCYRDHVLGRVIERYKASGRPLFCTEYMARPESTFATALPLLNEHGVAAINWGLVSGKSGTVWPWSGRDGKDVYALRKIPEQTVLPGQPFPEPELWFHDILRTDGSPFDPAEVEILQEVTHLCGKAPGS